MVSILTESGLLPGALLHNTSHKFICKNIYLKQTNNSLLTNKCITKLKIPMLTERKVLPQTENAKSLVKMNKFFFDKDGNVSDASNRINL